MDFHQSLNEEETKDNKQAAQEPAADITDEDDKTSKVPQETQSWLGTWLFLD
jgi:hypothetical protein